MIPSYNQNQIVRVTQTVEGRVVPGTGQVQGQGQGHARSFTRQEQGFSGECPLPQQSGIFPFQPIVVRELPLSQQHSGISSSLQLPHVVKEIPLSQISPFLQQLPVKRTSLSQEQRQVAREVPGQRNNPRL